MKHKKKKIAAGLISILLIWMVVLHFQEYNYPNKEDIDKRLNYLERVIKEPLDSHSTVLQLSIENSEFMLFSYAYTSYAATNLAVTDSTYKNRAEKIIKESILKVMDNAIASPYSIDTKLLATDSICNYSVLYLGHLNLMMGCYRLISCDTAFNNLNDTISKSLFSRYSNSPIFNLESYPFAIWIPDNTVAIASLKLHGTNAKSGYDSICSKWVEYAKENYLHKETSVLYSTIDLATGKANEEPRGSMLGWSIMFIYQFDSEFASELYNNYKKHFSNDFFVLRLFKERYKNSETNIGDIDSGPIFLGYSIPANEFSLGAAIMSGDYKTAKRLERLIAIGASKIDNSSEIKYKVRFVDMNISPMAEALLLNSLSTTRWVK